MKNLPGVLVALVSLFLGGQLSGASAEDSAPNTEAPYGLTQRVPFTTSRVVGSPEPPLPYHAVRTRPELGINFPIHCIHEPGTPNLFLSHEQRSMGESTISRIIDAPGQAKIEKLFEVDDVAYSLCAHPKFVENGYLYVGSNGPRKSDKKHSRVTRYTVSRTAPYSVDPQSAMTIIEWKSDGHDGAAIAFGLDGYLYVTTGDGTADSDIDVVGQRLDTLRAKVLRIDVEHVDEGKHYSVPKDNPFVDMPDACPETWAYGVRAPWRAHVDPHTGQLWVTQNGQDLYEQVYAVQRGANYGWSVMEGSHPFYLERKIGPTRIIMPTFEHSHAEARSLTGGVTYYGQKFPELRGAYIYGDFATGKIWAGKLGMDGKVEWHKEIADTTLAITSFAIDAQGELLITDHQGTGNGGLYTLEATPPKSPDTPDFPRQLSEAGLFESVKNHQMAAGVIPYSVNSPVWSDGAHKSRFIAIPESSGTEGQPPTITFNPTNSWKFPEGTVLVQSLALNLASSDSDAKQASKTENMKWIETRLLVLQNKEWVGYSYAWNDEQTDAMLVDSRGSSRELEVIGHDGAIEEQTWRFPSRSDCMVCHSRAAGFVLGVSAPQLNRDHDYNGVVDNQLRALSHAGVLKGLDKVPGDCDRLADPYDASQKLEARARSYLHTNCSVCHVAAGGGNSQMDLKYNTPDGEFKAIGVKPVHQAFGMSNAKIISPGHPEESVLLHRIKMRGAGQMPLIGSSQVDQRAVEMIEQWIKSLPEK